MSEKTLVTFAMLGAAMSTNEALITHKPAKPAKPAKQAKQEEGFAQRLMLKASLNSLKQTCPSCGETGFKVLFDTPDKDVFGVGLVFVEGDSHIIYDAACNACAVKKQFTC